jgi:hypothetical protein
LATRSLIDCLGRQAEELREPFRMPRPWRAVSGSNLELSKNCVMDMTCPAIAMELYADLVCQSGDGL